MIVGRTTRVIVIGLVALLLNSAWLWAFPDASFWYYLNVVVHPLLGIALAFVLVRRAPGWVAAPVLSGVAVLLLGATRPHYLLVTIHVVVSALTIALAVVALRRRLTLRIVVGGVATLLMVAAGAGPFHPRND